MKVWIFLFFLAATFADSAAEFSLNSAGARFGFPNHSKDNAGFLQSELFGLWNLPYRPESDRGWFLQSRLDASAGVLTDQRRYSLLASVGPSFEIGKKTFPFAVELGWNPTLISQHDFETKDLGALLQFVSYAGLHLNFASHFRLGYRFQHMSNGGFNKPNPGLNLHMFHVAYTF